MENKYSVQQSEHNLREEFCHGIVCEGSTTESTLNVVIMLMVLFGHMYEILVIKQERVSFDLFIGLQS